MAGILEPNRFGGYSVTDKGAGKKKPDAPIVAKYENPLFQEKTAEPDESVTLAQASDLYKPTVVTPPPAPQPPPPPVSKPAQPPPPPPVSVADEQQEQPPPPRAGMFNAQGERVLSDKEFEALNVKATKSPEEKPHTEPTKTETPAQPPPAAVKEPERPKTEPKRDDAPREKQQAAAPTFDPRLAELMQAMVDRMERMIAQLVVINKTIVDSSLVNQEDNDE